MNLRRAVGRSVAALSATTLPLALSAHPSAADEGYSTTETFLHTFTMRSSGERVTCSVSGGSGIFRPTDREAFSITAFTEADGAATACHALVAVFVIYRDVHGTPKDSGASGEGYVVWFANDSGYEVEAQHLVGFVDCEANCVAEFTTRPK